MAGDEQTGVNIIKRSCEEPIRQISGNAGYEGAVIMEKILHNKDRNFGFNAATGVYEDLVKAGVIDPTKVTLSALQNAASISALMLTTECMICEVPEKSAPGGGNGGGGGQMPGMDY
jgi:chaperonin GroEL